MNKWKFHIFKLSNQPYQNLKTDSLFSSTVCLEYLWAPSHPWFHLWTLPHFLASSQPKPRTMWQMGTWEFQGQGKSQERRRVVFHNFFLFRTQKSRSLMFCFVDHRKLLLTSAKILHFSGSLGIAGQKSLYISSRNALCSRWTHLGEENFYPVPTLPSSFYREDREMRGYNSHLRAILGIEASQG